ncbi:MAG: prolyl oligopeptidase family serine peptidase [Actinomycetota bacterium]
MTQETGASEPRAAPYGTWPSPIGASMLATAGVDLMEPWLEDGSVYWLEGRPAEGGRQVVVRGDAWSSPTDITPQGFNARTTVHEYGGGSYVVHRGTVYFSNFADQRLYAQPEGGAPTPITSDSSGRHRYADCRVTPDGSLLVCVRERHEDDGVVNELVAVPTTGGDVRTIVGGRDFFSAPRVAPDGSKLAWLSWDLPWMPWDGCELWVGDLGADGAVTNARRVAGADGQEAIVQPEWGPSGELHFVSDRSGWWNLYRDEDGGAAALHRADKEFGGPLWLFGASNYAFLGDGRIACQYASEGVSHLAVLDPASGELLDLDLPYTAFDYPWLHAEGSQLVFVGGAASMPMQVVSLDFVSRGVEVLRESMALDLDPEIFSSPRTIEFPTEGGLTAFAHFYPPHHPGFRAPEGELPPLIVMSHGGPTSEANAEFDLSKQFFTSRGFGVVDVNYGGSTGYGRAYRRRLNGNWGVVDTMDCINAARSLVEAGEADGERLLIRGGSAGGYTTLCALTFHDVFAAGASYYGISDLEPFATGDTHKFESRYEHTLVGPFPESIDLYRARSPIHFVDLISCPMILLQGDEDKVVPPSQSEVMVAALAAKGLPHAYLLFQGEQHGFRKAETIRRAAEAELSFYAQILGFELGDTIEPVEITRS